MPATFMVIASPGCTVSRSLLERSGILSLFGLEGPVAGRIALP